MKQKIYTPTTQCVMLPLLTITVLGLVNAHLISRRFFSDAANSGSTAHISVIGQYLNSDIANSIGFFIFWWLVGAAVYAVLGVVVLIVHPLITMTHLHQAVGHRTAKRVQRLEQMLFTRFVLRTVAAACLVVWLAANVSFILRFIDGATVDFIQTGDILRGLLAIVVGTINLFIPVVLVRFLMLRTRLF